MYAIIQTGGKQYRVKKGDVIDVELLDAKIGVPIEFNEVFLIQDDSHLLVGAPCVEDYLVKGEVIGYSAGPKIISLKYKPRQHQQKKWGHRQHYTRVKITEIGTGGPEKSAAVAETAKNDSETPSATKASDKTKNEEDRE
ncbi:MAG: 50S ribosomal protein L21 [Waddliaceae bacterium]